MGSGMTYIKLLRRSSKNEETKDTHTQRHICASISMKFYSLLQKQEAIEHQIWKRISNHLQQFQQVIIKYLREWITEILSFIPRELLEVNWERFHHGKNTDLGSRLG